MNDNTNNTDDPDDTLQGFEQLETLLRETDADDATLLEPPPEIWAAIETSIGTQTTAVPVAATPVSDTSNITVLADRRRPRAWLGAVAAATMLLFAGALTVIAVRSASESEPIVAQATLTWDAATFDPIGATATATAELVGDESGYTIDIDQTELPEPDGDGEELELWLIQPDSDNDPVALVSLGTVDSSSSTYLVPDGVNPADYFVVDISVEPSDGNPAHSGRSILRGPLIEA